MKVNNNNGFTLIEALVSIVIIGVIGTVTVGILSQTFQTNTKTQLLSTIKQNGQSALNFIDQVIRTADTVICVGNSGSVVTAGNPDSETSPGDTIVTKDSINTFTRIRIKSDSQGAPNNFIAVDTPIPPDPSTPYTLCGNATSMLTTTTLIDTTSMKISVKGYPDSGSADFFALSKSYGTQDSVQISFYLAPSSNSPPGFENTVGESNQQLFQTTVTLR